MNFGRHAKSSPIRIGFLFWNLDRHSKVLGRSSGMHNYHVPLAGFSLQG
jgi:hypothetical protein